MRRREEVGITIIELVVVLLVIAGLLAIAIPVFLGARSRAQDRDAEARAKLAHETARVFLADDTTFTDLSNLTGRDLQALEPSLDFVRDNKMGNENKRVAPAGKEVSWWADADEAVFVALSRSGKAFYVYERTATAISTAQGSQTLVIRGSFDTGGAVEATPETAIVDATTGSAVASTTTVKECKGSKCDATTTTVAPTTTTAAPTTTTAAPTTTAPPTQNQPPRNGCPAGKVWDPNAPAGGNTIGKCV